jgi:multiple sugar transport system permease protein
MVSARPRHRRNRKRNKDSIIGFLFVAPAVLFLGALILYPLLDLLHISLFKTNLINVWNYQGAMNYIELLRTPETWDSLRTSFVYTIVVVVGTLILGMLAALLLNIPVKGQTFFRSVVMWPWVISGVAASIMWQWMLSTRYGIINHVFLQVGIIAEPISWLGQMHTALPSLAVVSIWKAFPFVAITLLAGIQAIPLELYEAARVDGASGLQCWRYITLPGLRGILRLLVLLETVWWFREFTLPNMLTSGGPLRATETVVIRAYKMAFEFFEFGKASALSVIIFFISFLVVLAYNRLLPEQ